MLNEKFQYQTRWIVRRYADDAAFAAGAPTPVVDGAGHVLPAESEIAGNVLLNEGIALLLDLLIGAGGTAYNNANARIGVGESSAAEAASQGGLQGGTTTFRPMESSYPNRSNQTATWRAVFGGSDANNAWNEFTVVNASSDTGTNLNRRVSAQGTKASGQTWTVDISLTIS
jgi:hypothetical protein